MRQFSRKYFKNGLFSKKKKLSLKQMERYRKLNLRCLGYSKKLLTQLNYQNILNPQDCRTFFGFPPLCCNHFCMDKLKKGLSPSLLPYLIDFCISLSSESIMPYLLLNELATHQVSISN